MKRSVFLATCLLLSIRNMTAEPCIINDPLLSTIDNIFNRLHPEYNMSHVIYLTKFVEERLHETFTNPAHKQVSLAAMVELENSLPDKKKLQKFTERCVEKFVIAVQQEHLLELFSSLQDHYRILVGTWAEQRSCKASPFVRFSMTWKEIGTELTVMNSTITTLADYQRFLQDLHTFLEDLTASLPNAYAEYQECAKTNAHPTFR